MEKRFVSAPNYVYQKSKSKLGLIKGYFMMLFFPLFYNLICNYLTVAHADVKHSTFENSLYCDEKKMFFIL